MSLPAKETLSIEFKSDQTGLSDDDLIEVVVGMANSEGGDIYVGIEDDGTPTGLHPRHSATAMLSAMIGNRTQPAVAVRVEKIRAINGMDVVQISVPMMREIVMTSGGKLLRRRLGSDGAPCTVPMHPYEIASRLSRFGKFDFSAQPCPDATLADFDPIERLRLRQAIEINRGERALLELSDEELDGALGLVTRSDGVTLPTHAGMLLLGRQDRLRYLIPTHELMLQELRGSAVRVNEGLRLPFIALIERVTALFDGRYEEDELMVGMYRMPLPNYDRVAFREGLVNALAHRDYTVNNAIHIQFTDRGLSISNPGGFIEGVSTENILVTEPRSRNHVLADALKRIGLAERTGRGVDNIFRAVLRAGRPMPTYTESTDAYIKLFFPLRAADLAFVKQLIDLRDRLDNEPTLEMLIILRTLREMGSATSAELIRLAQRQIAETMIVLLKTGVVVEEKGERYCLAGVPMKEKNEDLDSAQMRQRIVDYVQTRGKITRKEVMEVCQLNGPEAYRLLRNLTRTHTLIRRGERKAAEYILNA